MIADNPGYGPPIQPTPINGECPLVFRSDKYDTQLAQVLEQAVVAVARGVRFDASVKAVDDPSDDVDAVAAFVDHIEAIADGSCAGGSVRDTNGDGLADTFDAVVPGSDVCFRITTHVNDTVPPNGARKFRVLLQPLGNGIADLAPGEVWFVKDGHKTRVDSGRSTVNSVNTSTCDSTVMSPPCSSMRLRAM